MKISTKWIGGAAILSALGVTAFHAPPMRDAQAQNTVTAPELTGKRWFNTQGQPITLASRRGKVTVVEFWTFGCSNCRANLPAYARWQKKFAAQGVEVIGVHTPELDYERDPKNVEKFLREQNITYPIVTDESGENWRKWKQQYWPTIFLIDKAGRVRHKHIGELQGEEGRVTGYIETLLKEAAPSPNRRTKMTKITKTDQEWRAELTPAAYNVLRQKGTERPFSNDIKNPQKGVYQCAGCGQELFASDAKFDSGTGWPSFYQPIAADAVEEEVDGKFFMKRTEILCSRCEGHLGHVFPDGPAPTGLRYCMNGVALKFEPKE